MCDFQLLTLSRGNGREGNAISEKKRQIFTLAKNETMIFVTLSRSLEIKNPSSLIFTLSKHCDWNLMYCGLVNDEVYSPNPTSSESSHSWDQKNAENQKLSPLEILWKLIKFHFVALG